MNTWNIKRGQKTEIIGNMTLRWEDRKQSRSRGQQNKYGEQKIEIRGRKQSKEDKKQRRDERTGNRDESRTKNRDESTGHNRDERTDYRYKS